MKYVKCYKTLLMIVLNNREGDPISELSVKITMALLCDHNVKKFDNTGEDLEDLISIGTIGLNRNSPGLSRPGLFLSIYIHLMPNRINESTICLRSTR